VNLEKFCESREIELCAETFLRTLFQVDILKFWQQQASFMPNLAKIARDNLCVPMTSTSSERMFSSSGQIISPARSSLNPETTSKLIYIQQNYGVVKVREWNVVSEVDKPTSKVLEGEQLKMVQDALRQGGPSKERAGPSQGTPEPRAGPSRGRSEGFTRTSTMSSGGNFEGFSSQPSAMDEGNASDAEYSDPEEDLFK
jgi:hypothetical protein